MSSKIVIKNKALEDRAELWGKAKSMDKYKTLKVDKVAKAKERKKNIK